MTSVLDTIVELQQQLRDLDEARVRLEEVPEWMRELHVEHTGHREAIETLRTVAQEAERDRRTAESAVEDSQEKLSHYQQQIAQVSTQREYKALLKEIDTVKEVINTHEETAFAALEKYEEAQKELGEKEAGFRDLDERYRVERAKWDEEKPAVATEIQNLEGRIEALRSRVPRGPLTQFERLLQKHRGEAIAAIAKTNREGPNMWHCGFCNYRVRPQVVVEIRNNGSLIHCDSCHRFLYLSD